MLLGKEKTASYISVRAKRVTRLLKEEYGIPYSELGKW